eukprot:7274076-Pyramimonas_sp.AAC.1
MRAAAGTEHFPAACRACSDALSAARRAFIQRTGTKLRAIRRGNKRWWQCRSVFSSRVAKPISSPLKKPSGSWAVSSVS